MKVFLSHSGVASRLVAKSLNDWLQRIIQAVKPFYSPEIDKGANWSNKVDEALEGTQFGIICLTSDNLSSEWIHYESGALSKTKDASICTFLLDIKPSDVKQPIGKFQHTLAEKSDVLKMLKSINTKVAESGENSLTEKLLEEIFTETWNKLDKLLDEAKKEIKNSSNSENNKPNENIRNTDDKLDEILEILRSSQRENFPKKTSISMEDTIVGKTLISRGAYNLNSAGLVDTVMANATSAANAKSGYYLTMTPYAAASGIPSRFDCDSQPVTHTTASAFAATGSRRFFITETGVVYANTSNAAITANSTTRVVTGASSLNN